MCFLRREAGGSERRPAAIGELVAEAGHTPIGWRDVPVDETAVRRAGPRVAPRDPPALHRRRRGHRRRDGLRALALRDPPPRRGRAGAEGLVPELVLPDDRLQGDADGAAAAAVLPRPPRHDAAQHVRDRPLALLDQHRAELGARPAAADDRPQRRDQHRPRQRQLDARPRGRALLRGARRRPPGLPAADRRGRLRLRRLRPRARADRARRAHPPARDDDDDPGRLGGPRGRPAGRARGLLPLPRPAARAVGRARGDRLQRRRARSARCSTATACARAAGRSPATAGSASARSRGSSPSTPEKVARMGRLEPGAALRRRPRDAASSAPTARSSWHVAGAAPYGEWYAEGKLGVRELPDPHATIQPVEPLLQRQLAFGYTQEDMRTLLAPLLRDGREPTGSMGNDLSLAVFSDHRPSLFSYFKQRFAQVTNPAIDSVREQVVMSLRTDIGPQGNLLSERAADRQPRRARAADPHRLRARAAAPQPLRRAAPDDDRHHLRAREGRGRARERARPDPRARRSRRSRRTRRCSSLSDRATGPDRVPIPSLLACSTVHHALVREGTRLRAALVVESGEPREIHHLAALIGYGATAINPYLMLETMTMLDEPTVGLDGPLADACERAIAGISKGLLKVLSKIGIATIRSYRGAQIFEIVGIDEDRRRRALHRHPLAARRHRPRRDRRRGARPPRAGLPRGARDRPGRARRGGQPRRRARGAAAAGRRLPLAPRRREAHVGSGDDRLAPARRPLGEDGAARYAPTRSSAGSSTRRTRATRCCAACSTCASPTPRTSCTRSRRRARSSSASRPAR